MNKHFFAIIALLGTLVMPLHGGPLEFDGWEHISPEELLESSTSELDHCKAQILQSAGIIQYGKELLKRLYAGEDITQLTSIITGLKGFYNPKFTTAVNQANAIIWALYGIAGELKKGYFTEGTFVIDDPGLKLYTFLSNISDTYKRSSTHFNEFKTNKYLDKHNGLDLEGLPCNKRHILFDKLTDDRIFIKPENFGLEKISDSIGHIRELIVAKARKIESLRSLFNLTSDQDTNFKKERISQDIITKYRNILNQLEPDKETVELAVKLGKEYGLQKIIPTLKEYMLQYQPLKNILPQQPQPSDVSTSWHVVTQQDYDQARDLLDKVVDFLEQLATQDNLMQRTGNEIIITQADLKRALAGKTSFVDR